VVVVVVAVHLLQGAIPAAALALLVQSYAVAALAVLLTYALRAGVAAVLPDILAMEDLVDVQTMQEPTALVVAVVVDTEEPVVDQPM
jgi:hypothetical protein